MGMVVSPVFVASLASSASMILSLAWFSFSSCYLDFIQYIWVLLRQNQYE
jgi:hypothetical protein